MPRYGDDQCEECGGIRVAKSTLCASCLLRQHEADQIEILIKKKTLGMYKRRSLRDSGRLEDALAYGFKQNQENVKLHRYIEELEQEIYRGWKHEKDGETEDTEKG